jgi:16S rRNA (uracil1498-N3)-methyltransferase
MRCRYARIRKIKQAKMKEVRYFFVPDASSASELPEEETIHALRVLRLAAGDEMMLMDGEGKFYSAVVTMASSKHCLYDIQEVFEQSRTWNGHLHIAIAPTKMMERMEWFTEKSVEIGIDELSFLDCKFSERQKLRIDRLEKIVVAAVKQSRKPFMTRMNGMKAFDDFINEQRSGRKFIAHCYDEIDKKYLFDELQTPSDDGSDDVTVMIGPEGDFSIDEVKRAMAAGYESISLGESRLRTETAGLSAAMMMQISRRKK